MTGRAKMAQKAISRQQVRQVNGNPLRTPNRQGIDHVHDADS
ncbi:unnamed protein product [marine sediment metagenome]|uniref:Uncharacterized protein n=1 Tax=marine sediment metagenome TaxID=412755 RepID=X0U0C5_9ZZZZ